MASIGDGRGPELGMNRTFSASDDLSFLLGCYKPLRRNCWPNEEGTGVNSCAEIFKYDTPMKRGLGKAVQRRYCIYDLTGTCRSNADSCLDTTPAGTGGLGSCTHVRLCRSASSHLGAGSTGDDVFRGVLGSSSARQSLRGRRYAME
jgi:hypothetical protein